MDHYVRAAGPGQPFRRPRLRGVIETIVFDVGETITRDDRYWESWADWLDVPRHTLSALVGAVVARGQDNAEALRLVRPGIDVAAEYHARETAGRGEYLDESDLYDDVRPALSALRELGVRVVVAGNQTSRAGGLLRALDLPADLVVTSGDWGWPSRNWSSSSGYLRWPRRYRTGRSTSVTIRPMTFSPPSRPGCASRTSAVVHGGICGRTMARSWRRRTGASTVLASSCPSW